MRLKTAQVEAFKRDGYVLDNGFLNESELAHLLNKLHGNCHSAFG